MRQTKYLLVLGALALAVVSAASTYHVSLLEPAWVGATELKPGAYNLRVDGDQAVISLGKDIVDAHAKLETSEEKFTDTELITTDVGGKKELREIRIGGTRNKIVFPFDPM